VLEEVPQAQSSVALTTNGQFTIIKIIRWRVVRFRIIARKNLNLHQGPHQSKITKTLKKKMKIMKNWFTMISLKPLNNSLNFKTRTMPPYRF
jgi:hypothetical protein